MEGTQVHSLGTWKLGVLLAVTIAFFILFFAIDIEPTGQSYHEMKPCDAAEGSKWYEMNNCMDNSTFRGQQLSQHSFYLELPENPLSFIVWDLFLFVSVDLDLGIINFDSLDQLNYHDPVITATFKTDVGYRNFEEAGRDWKTMLRSETEIDLKCKVWLSENAKNQLHCSSVPFFELGSVNHDHYLVNTHISIGFKWNTSHDTGVYIKGASATVGHQAEDFTKAMFALKLFFFPLVVIVLFWYNARIRKNRGEPAPVEKSLIALGVTLSVLNFPLEWLIVWIDFPSIHLLNDIRLVFFYAAFFHFFTFWIGENQVEKPEKVWSLWGSQLSTSQVVMPFIVIIMLVFHLAVRIPPLENPFFVMEQTEGSRKAILAFVITVGTFFGMYSVLQMRNTASGMKNVLGKYQGAVRIALVVALAANVLVALLTVAYFFVANFHWFFMKYETIETEESGALYFGVYGTWNLYAVVFMILLAPDTLIQISDPQDGDIGMAEDAKIVDAGIETCPVWFEDSL